MQNKINMEHKLTLQSYIYFANEYKIVKRKIISLEQQQDKKIKIGLTDGRLIFYISDSNIFRDSYGNEIYGICFTYAEAAIVQKQQRQQKIEQLYKQMVSAQDTYQNAVSRWFYTEFVEENKNNDEDLCSDAE